jgi:hypothetical protein
MKKVLSYLFVLLLTSACSNEIEEIIKDKNQDKESTVILQKRDPELPKIWAKRKAKTKNASPYLPPEKYLGYSYRIGNTIIGDNINTGFPVIDIDRFEKKYSSLINHYNIASNEVGGYSYATFNRYENNSSVTKKVNSGFELNLGLFKAGRKKTITEKFGSKLENENKNVYGEVWVEVRNGLHSLQTISSARKRIAADYLNEIFLDALYNTSIVELLDEFGPFVLTGYYTGGRASALYLGKYTSNVSSENKEREMDEKLNASFSWGKKEEKSSGSASGDLGFGGKYSDSTTIDKHTTGVYYTVKTTGGSHDLTVNSPIGEVDQFGIDLTPWLQSLNDASTHTLIGIQDEGITGISDFVLEENFKQRIHDTHLDYVYNDELLEPIIEIVKVYVRSTSSGERLYEVAPVLNTRQGDKIILSDGLADQASDAELRANNNYNTFMSKSQAIANQKKDFYKCTIQANPDEVILPFLRQPLCFELEGLDENRMYKFMNENTNMWYIYDPVAHYAFAYYLDDYILDAYGIYDWIDSVEEKPISTRTLSMRYRIIGL